MMEKGDDCAEIQLYKQQVFELTDELLKINERLAALAEETDQSQEQEKIYQTICNLWNGSLGEGFRKEPIPVQRDKIKQVLQRAEWDGEKLRLFLRGTR